MAKMLLSKSEYMMFLKHPAWLWLKKHDKDKLPPPDDNLQAMFDAGNAFEGYAEQLFAGGVRLGFDNYQEYLSLPERTKKALAEGTKTIFQGRFEHEQLTFICDVLEVVGERMVDLTEIKSSTTAKADHEYDLAFQVYVLEKCGWQVRNVAVVHVNNEYVRSGAIDPNKLCSKTDVSHAVRQRLSQTERDIQSALKVMSEPTMPNPSPARCRLGSLKEWLTIYKGLVDVEEGSIFELCRLDPSLIAVLEEEGITKLRDIHPDYVQKPAQKLQLEVVRSGKQIVKKDKIRSFLDGLEYPLYFFDYETLSSVVPYFDGMRPYGQYPFQYSLHVIDYHGATPRHMSYLHKHNSNPAESLSATLSQQIGPSGTVLAWYMGFEKACNTTLGEMAPEYAEFFANINKRMQDLMFPFSKGWYVDAAFGGSASIKKVLPALVPSLSYKELDIQEGGAAQRLWMEAVLEGKRDDEKDSILAALDKYCELDTWAMVEIFNFLTQLVGENSIVGKPQQLALDW